MSSRFTVQFGGVYDTEPWAGTVNDPSDETWTTISWLDPLFLNIGSNGTINELRLLANKTAEDFDAAITRGQHIKIFDSGYDTGGMSSSSSSGGGSQLCIFEGVVMNEHIVIAGTEVVCQAICFDHGSFLLHRMPLHGQYRRNYSLESTYFSSGASGPHSVYIDGTESNSILLGDEMLVFNPDGQPNMTEEYFTDASAGDPNIFAIFDAPFRYQYTSSGVHLQAEYWTLREAVQYLLRITNANWAIDTTSFSFDALFAAFSAFNPTVSNINCEGKSLAQALTDLVCPHGYIWWVDTALTSSTGTSSSSSGGGENLQQIHFVFKGDGSGGNSTTVDLSTPGTNALVSDANLVHCDLNFDNGSTVNALAAYGDRINFTVIAQYGGMSSSSSSGGPTPKVLTLVQGWKSSDLVFPPNDSSGNPDWYDPTFRSNYCNDQLITPMQSSSSSAIGSGVFAVGRVWYVNEGEVPGVSLENLSADLLPPMMSSSSSSSGGPSPTALTGNNSVDTRQLLKPQLYTKNTNGGLLSQFEITVEMSTDGGTNWSIVDKPFYKVLTEGMGIVFIPPALEMLGYDILNSNPTSSSSSGGAPNDWGKNYWQALHDNTLAIRILCSVKSDERVKVLIPNDGSAFPLAIGAVFNNDGYKKTVYASQINGMITYTQYAPQPLAQDDTAALLQMGQTQLMNTNRTTIGGVAAVLMEDFGQYYPGQVITGIGSRVFDFGVGNGDGPTVLKVLYKFQELQVELTLDNHRIASVVRAKPINNAANLNQHKLGVENPQAGIGQQVPIQKFADPDSQGKAIERYYERGGQ